MSSLGTILGIWAHPDDEAYLAAGVMAMAARDGDRVVCVTATRGEHGTPDAVRWPPELLGPAREAELATSLEILGVTEHLWLDYRDGECADVPEREAVDIVAKLIDDVRPDSVVTFGPDGMTGHPDHRAVSAWTTAAFEQAAGTGSRLLYATKTAPWAKRFAPIVDPLGVFYLDGPPQTPPEELAHAIALPDDILDLKVAALSAQRTQVGPILEAMGADNYRSWVAYEWFRLGSSGRARRG